MIDWMIDDNLSVLKDGTPTRIDKASGGLSTPEITFVGEKWINKSTWTKTNLIGDSDHQLIFIEITTNFKYVAAAFGAKWKSKDVDWDAFRNTIEANEESLNLETTNIKSLVESWNNVIISSAEENVGKVKPVKKGGKSWMTRDEKIAIKKRNWLRRTIKSNRREWVEACKSVQEEIRNAKNENWKEYLEESIDFADEGQIWTVVKSLNGLPSTNSKTKPSTSAERNLLLQKLRQTSSLIYYCN